MTPLATQVANQLTLPVAKRELTDDAKIIGLIGSDLHCFDVTAVAKSVHEALDADNLWPDVEAMLPNMFLPSPVTWLEYRPHGGIMGKHLAWVLEDQGQGTFRLSMVMDTPDLFTLPLCDFRARGILEPGERIAIKINYEVEEIDKAYKRGFKAGLGESVGELSEQGLPIEQRLPLLQNRLGLHETEHKYLSQRVARLQAAAEQSGEFEAMVKLVVKLGIAFSVLTLDLINTPGLIGLRQRDVHRGIARKLASVRGGSYPLRSWSEVVLKHQTQRAEPGERLSGTTYHKCLHFVRSHLRHYQCGKVSIIPAHWRGDPALGIKRTRYKVAA